MKNTMLCVFALLIFSCSSNNATSNKEAVQKALLTYLSKDLNKNKLEKIDSFEIVSMDSVTELQTITIIQDLLAGKISTHERILADLRYNYTDDSIMLRREGNNPVQQKKLQGNADNLKKFEARVARLKFKNDSLLNAMQHADATTFIGWLVKTKFLYRSLNDVSQERADFIVTKDLKIKSI